MFLQTNLITYLFLYNLFLLFPETSDDILAKYRTPKKGGGAKGGAGKGGGEEGEEDQFDSPLAAGEGRGGGSGEEEGVRRAGSETGTGAGVGAGVGAEVGIPFLDKDNLEASFAFQDAKRKLRLVLSLCEVQPALTQVSTSLQIYWDFFLPSVDF